MKSLTWNPTIGCTGKRESGYRARRCIECSPGDRFAPAIAALRARKLDESADELADVLDAAGRKFDGSVTLREDTLEAPLKRKTPTHYRWGTMGDPFGVDEQTLERVLEVIDKCPQHLFTAVTYFHDTAAIARRRNNLVVAVWHDPSPPFPGVEPKLRAVGADDETKRFVDASDFHSWSAGRLPPI
jgi:protein gp37